jgi:hypothetical protein
LQAAVTSFTESTKSDEPNNAVGFLKEFEHCVRMHDVDEEEFCPLMRLVVTGATVKQFIEQDLIPMRGGWEAQKRAFLNRFCNARERMDLSNAYDQIQQGERETVLSYSH